MEFAKKHVKIVVLFACLAASMSPILIRLAGDMPPMAIGFYRLGFAMPFFIFMALAYHRDNFKKLSRRQLAGSIMAGGFLFLHFLTFISGVGKTTVASAVVLACLHPVVILIVTTVFFKEKKNLKIIAGVVIALLGGAVVGGGDYAIAGEALMGDLLCFVSAIMLALYFIAGQKLGSGIETPVYLMIVFGCCWIFFGLGMLVSGTSFTGYEGKSLLWVFVLSIVCQIIGHGLFNWTLRYISPLYLATSETIEVIYSSFIAFILFHEIPVPMQYIGGSMTIAGILLYNYFEAEAAGELVKVTD
ncbi:DMT family transporter [Bacillota bacterium]